MECPHLQAKWDVHFNGNTSGWYPLTNGLASFIINQGLPVGTYTWFFDYSGDNVYSQDFSQIFIQHVVARPPSLLWQSIGNTGEISWRLFANWPPGLIPIYEIQIYDSTNPTSGFTGQIGVQFYGIGGYGTIDVLQGGELIWRGGINLYFNAVPMIGSTIYLNMVNGSVVVWISWNIPIMAILDWNAPAVTAYDTPYSFGNRGYVFLRLFDPYDGHTIGPDIGNFLNP